MKKRFANEFIEFTYKSGSTYQAVNLSSEILKSEGFKYLDYKKEWDLKEGGKYFLKRTNSTLIAFTVGKEINEKSSFRIIGSHTDSPTFRIKPNSEMNSSGYLRLNTEVYGGPILNTWFDRPLSIAGQVIVKTDSVFAPKTINVMLEEPLLIIPNLAIHQNNKVNEGIAIDRQNDVLPILTLVNKKLGKNYLIDLLSDKYSIKKEDILDFDLYLFNYEKGCLIGDEFISAPKIDNLASLYSAVHSLSKSKIDKNNINIMVGFDNEEIGSATKQGADSNYLAATLERILYSLGKDRKFFLEMSYRSFLISADGAHAIHPAHPEKTDPIVKPLLNSGVVLKISANQKYTSDGYSISVIKQLVKNRINLQYFVNNSRYRGGSTIGPLSSTHLDIDAVDLGIPMLAMHSVRELCGIDDLYDLKTLFDLFYSV